MLAPVSLSLSVAPVLFAEATYFLPCLRCSFFLVSSPLSSLLSSSPPNSYATAAATATAAAANPSAHARKRGRREEGEREELSDLGRADAAAIAAAGDDAHSRPPSVRPSSSPSAPALPPSPSLRPPPPPLSSLSFVHASVTSVTTTDGRTDDRLSAAGADGQTDRPTYRRVSPLSPLSLWLEILSLSTWHSSLASLKKLFLCLPCKIYLLS